MATTTELEKRLDALEAAFDQRIVSLGERVVMLENVKSVSLESFESHENRMGLIETAVEEMPEKLVALRDDLIGALTIVNEKIDNIKSNGASTDDTELRAVVSALHERIMGVPLGAVQTLAD